MSAYPCCVVEKGISAKRLNIAVLSVMRRSEDEGIIRVGNIVICSMSWNITVH